MCGGRSNANGGAAVEKNPMELAHQNGPPRQALLRTHIKKQHKCSHKAQMIRPRWWPASVVDTRSWTEARISPIRRATFLALDSTIIVCVPTVRTLINDVVSCHTEILCPLEARDHRPGTVGGPRHRGGHESSSIITGGGERGVPHRAHVALICVSTCT